MTGLLHASLFLGKPLLCLAIFLAALAAGSSARGQNAGHRDWPFERFEYEIVTVESPRRYGSETAVEILLNNRAGVESQATQRITVDRYYWDAEIVEAATLKADGRLIEVPAENIVVQYGTHAEEVFYDTNEAVYTIAFPDAVPGDRIRYAIRYKQKRPEIPGGFALTFLVKPSERYAQYGIAVDAPENMQLRTDASGFGHKETRANGRAQHEWWMRPVPYAADEQASELSYDRGTHLLISTFEDTQAAAGGFCNRADAKARVTPNLVELASRFRPDLRDRRSQAEALFRAVASQIRYMSITQGDSGQVPHSPSQILENRFGDCKDMTTLLRALLAVKGIESELVLINSDNIYKPFKVPLFRYNHAILYIPDFGVYIDPTDQYSSFEILPQNLQDKPVLHCGAGGKVRASRVPPSSETQNSIAITAGIVIRPGTVEGKLAISGMGEGAQTLRTLNGNLQKASEQGSSPAWAALVKPDSDQFETKAKSPDSAGEPYVFEAAFTIADNYLDETDPKTIGTVLEPIDAPFQAWKDVAIPGRKTDFVCPAVSYRQDIAFTLPLGRVPRVPADVSIKRGPAEFTARYAFSGQTFEAHRTFVVRYTPGSVCRAAMAETMAPVIQAALQDARRRLVLMLDSSAAPGKAM